jgi:hypothetical protein
MCIPSYLLLLLLLLPRFESINLICFFFSVYAILSWIVMHLYRNIVFVKILVLFSYIFFSNVLCVHSIMATQRKVWAGGGNENEKYIKVF